MTAITFPLKKFPGQLKHESMGFTGRVIAQPIILSVSLAFHIFLVYLMETRFVEALFYSLPLLFSIALHVAYLLKVMKSDFDYFDMNLAKLRTCFNEDKDYFNMVCDFGATVSMSVIAFAYIGETIAPLLVSVNSSLLSLMYCASVYMGLYTKKRITAYTAVVVIVEAAIVLGLVAGANLVLYSLTALTMILYIRERTKEYSLIRLLQIIIK